MPSLKDDLDALMSIGVVTVKGEIAPEFNIDKGQDEKYLADAKKMLNLVLHGHIDVFISENNLTGILEEFIRIKEAEIARKSLHE